MNTKLLIALALLCLVAADSDPVFQEFMKFTEKYRKNYSTLEEFRIRFNVFSENFHRLQKNAAGKTHNAGITKYFDLTLQEFRRSHLNLRPVPGIENEGQEYLEAIMVNVAPATWDWRDHGAVGPVKDQGQCGSCWTFSTVGNLEGLHAIKTGKIVQYSEQQIVDCDTQGEDQGCNGGWMANAFDYIKKAGGIETEQDYPYTAEDDTCVFDIKKAVLQVKDKILNRNMDEVKLKEFLYNNGPLAIAFNAEDSIMDYTSGIVDIDSCDPTILDHGVTLVGYGTEAEKDFWIVKNSWGADWGENGYFRMARGKGMCGINTYITSAVLP
jgi:C1A family cysteine protease